jgi:hypothetical protein
VAKLFGVFKGLARRTESTQRSASVIGMMTDAYLDFNDFERSWI